PTVWIDAFGQIFFTLSLAFGIMIAYASYLPSKSQIVRDAFLIGIINCAFSLFAGFGVFSVLGYMAHNTGLKFDEVITQSIGLAFVAYPKAISMLPFCSKVFGMIFFGSLVIAGLSSSVSIIEAFVSAVIDKFRYPRKIVVSVIVVFGFLGSIVFATQGGLLWLDIVDHFLMSYGLIVAGIFECLFVGWIFKANLLRNHINHHSSWKIGAWWDFLIRLVIPAVLGFILVTAFTEEIKNAYGGYSWLAIVLIGRDWLLYTLFAAIIVSGYSWRTDQPTKITS
ncbi:MAG: sodium-dependent transporter, partial [Candidatus Omnitrophica bacterium]|nr:sodium-dependent transporter [Candidatus Omnitrophota bacterium]